MTVITVNFRAYLARSILFINSTALRFPEVEKR